MSTYQKELSDLRGILYDLRKATDSCPCGHSLCAWCRPAVTYIEDTQQRIDELEALIEAE